MYLAHSTCDSGHQDSLARHLQAVATRAAEYAKDLGATEEACLAGLLHDLGKYGDLFQARLRGEAKGVDHWSAGACLCLEQYRKAGVGAALAITGHHLGLPAYDKLKDLGRQTSLRGEDHQGFRLSEERLEILLSRMTGDGLQLPPVPEATLWQFGDQHTAAAMLDLRMLYSVLVDADFIETEAHFQATRPELPAYRPSGPPLDARRASEVLRRYLHDLAAGSEAATEINQMRADLLGACWEAAEQPPGLFTLTAPTGAGKTLSMLAFALRHAEVHGLRRIVTVIPYLSIIEQTAQEYRKALARLCEERGPLQYVLEDHSLAGLRRPRGGEEPEPEYEGSARLLAENWDAPVVVTTSVQCLESLFSNRPSACRKLHRLARSVLLFDEVQTLPPRLAVPTLATLSRLAQRYGTTVVFATATQPAFEHLDEPVRAFCAAGWEPREIAVRKEELFSHARRTQVRWPGPDEPPLSWDDLAKEIAEANQALCIVNLKRHAWALLDRLESRDVDGLYHLSTSMCPAHRQEVLTQVRQRLAQGSPCRLVSTQCVEAGVDVDFPRVWRAWGPLDAIAQAAGRCNRNGRLPEGEVRLFIPDDEVRYPDDAYKQAAAVARARLEDWGRAKADIYAPEFFTEYYRELYDIAGLTRDRDDELMKALKRLDFPEVARLYRIIRDNAVNVLVPYDPDRFRELEDAIYAEGLTRAWVQRARPYSVGLYRPRDADPLWDKLERIPVNRKGGEYAEDWFIWTGDYDPLRGLVPVQSLECLIA